MQSAGFGNTGMFLAAFQVSPSTYLILVSKTLFFEPGTRTNVPIMIEASSRVSEGLAE